MAKKSRNKNRGSQTPVASADATSRGHDGTHEPAADDAEDDLQSMSVEGLGSDLPVGSGGVSQRAADDTASEPWSQAVQFEDAARDHDAMLAALVNSWAGDEQGHAPATGSVVDDGTMDFASGMDADPGLDAETAHDADADADAAEDPDAEGDSGLDTDAEDASPAEAPALGPEVAAQPAFDLGPVEVFDSGVGGGNPDDIRGVLIQLAGARLLLPNATIAEVLSYAEPDAIEGTPQWLLGRIRWRGWQLPLIAFSQLAGINTEERGGLGSKVVVLKALAGGKPPYFAVLTQGFPRLVTVSRSALVVDEEAIELPTAILAHVTLNRDDAYLPDLGRVEEMIAEAMAQAA